MTAVAHRTPLSIGWRRTRRGAGPFATLPVWIFRECSGSHTMGASSSSSPARFPELRFTVATRLTAPHIVTALASARD
jgi:hypothetical protein